MQQATTLEPGAHIAIVLGIMVAAGVFGGIVNFLTRKADPKDNTPARCIIVGMGASFLVPLFLNMISSDLLRSSSDDCRKLLVLTGLA